MALAVEAVCELGEMEERIAQMPGSELDPAPDVQSLLYSTCLIAGLQLRHSDMTDVFFLGWSNYLCLLLFSVFGSHLLGWLVLIIIFYLQASYFELYVCRSSGIFLVFFNIADNSYSSICICSAAI